jgi:LacI family transcriptional regulator
MVRARFHLWESGSTAQMVDVLGRLRGSHGVVLKAQDEPEVAEAIGRPVEGGVPVVTYTTGVPASSRRAYVGIDNHGAGVTAAYLMNQWLGTASSDVLITLSRNSVPRRKGSASRFPLGAARLRPGRSWKSAATASTRPTSG